MTFGSRDLEWQRVDFDVFDIVVNDCWTGVKYFGVVICIIGGNIVGLLFLIGLILFLLLRSSFSFLDMFRHWGVPLLPTSLIKMSLLFATMAIGILLCLGKRFLGFFESSFC